MSLPAVVVDQFLDTGLHESDLGQDLVGGRGPDERLRVGVPVGDVVTDLLDQYLHAGEGARRIDWRVMIPNQVSIWLTHDVPFGVKWNCTYGCASSHAWISGVAWAVGRLASN